MNTILETRNLNKIYHAGKQEYNHILKDINLKVTRGEFTAIMGQSGSGKSTLLYQLSGMDRMTDGSVLLAGEELAVMDEKSLAKLRLKQLGFIFQQSNLMKNLSILDNIILAPCLAKKESRRMILKKAKNLMKNTGISEIANRDITQVSGGQLQRAAICRALMNDPEVLFGDEPTGALNSSSTQEVLDILADINAAGTTIVLVTHDAKVAARADRVLYMTDGRITGEKVLGKYNAASDETSDMKTERIKHREEKLMKWLNEQGF